METRLKIALGLLLVYGFISTILGAFADVLFPLFGWAHNPGFGWTGQGIMLLAGIGTLILVVMMLRDEWF